LASVNRSIFAVVFSELPQPDINTAAAIRAKIRKEI